MEATGNYDPQVQIGTNGAFEKDVSTDPFHGSTPKSNVNTDFLLHEAGATHYEVPKANSYDSSASGVSSGPINQDSIKEPSPNSNLSMVMENGNASKNSESLGSEDDVCNFPESSDKNVTENSEDVSGRAGGDTVELRPETESNVVENVSNSDENTLNNEPIVDKKLNHADAHNESHGTTDSEEVTQNKEEKPKDEWLDILGSGHLLKKIIKSGEADSRPNKSDICTISYTGRLEDGTIVETVENLQIHLNDNEVIQGIDFSLSLMEEGEEAELKIGPRFAYGVLGRKPDIPSGATLYYTIALHDVREETSISTLPVKDRMSLGMRKKERGNWWYSRDEHSTAINCYRRALEYLDDTEIPEPHDEDEIHKLVEERLKTYNNLTASQMKIHAYDAALISVNYVLTSQPNNVKALFRKCKILREKGDIPEAIKAVRLALSFDKDSQLLQQELSSLLALQRKDNSKQRELYKKMMGTGSNQEKESDKKNSKNSYSAIKWTTFLAFAVVVVAGTVALKYKM